VMAYKPHHYERPDESPAFRFLPYAPAGYTHCYSSLCPQPLNSPETGFGSVLYGCAGRAWGRNPLLPSCSLAKAGQRFNAPSPPRPFSKNSIALSGARAYI
jgi:hypothetical protein